MKYVCSYCGKMLPVDRDIDDDRMFEHAVASHEFNECPREFLSVEEAPWLASRLAPEVPGA